MTTKQKPQGGGTVHNLTPKAGRVEPEPGWTAKHPRGHLRFDLTDAGRLVRVVDLVLFLVARKELPEKVAVAQVWAAFTEDAMPHLYLLREGDYAEPFPADFAFFKGVVAWEVGSPPTLPTAHGLAGLQSLAQGDGLDDLSAAVQAASKGVELSFWEAGTVGPLGLECSTLLQHLALTMDKAHELFLWGSKGASEPVGDAPPVVTDPALLTDWPSLVAYRRANPKADWGEGRQLEILRSELAKRGDTSKAKEAIAMELFGPTSTRQAIDGVLNRERMRDRKRAKASALPTLEVHSTGTGRKKAG